VLLEQVAAMVPVARLVGLDQPVPVPPRLCKLPVPPSLVSLVFSLSSSRILDEIVWWEHVMVI